MPGRTNHYGLEVLYQGDPFSSDGYKFTTTDRALIDKLAYIGAQGHEHNGVAALAVDPTDPPALTMDTTAGHLPASTRVYYRYTLVEPNGLETAGSPEAFQDTPAQVTWPSAPTLSAVDGGTLRAGAYFYVLSAYTGTDDTAETQASSPAFLTTTTVGSIMAELPALPSGAAGFNVYRMGPAEQSYLYVTSVQVLGTATPPTVFIDDGSFPDNCNRFSPTANTTVSTNEITVNIPVTPPDGWSWNLYRTITTGDYSASFVDNIASGTTYLDQGLVSTVGSPPLASQLVGSPSQIDLSTDVSGMLPVAQVNGLMAPVTFAFAGTLAPTTGVFCWTCPFTWAVVTSVQCTLGRGSAPAAQAVQVDVKYGTGANPTWADSLFAGGGYAEIPVGDQVGTATVPPVQVLSMGDSLSVDIIQAGGGATPTDHDLVVTLYLQVGLGSTPP